MCDINIFLIIYDICFCSRMEKYDEEDEEEDKEEDGEEDGKEEESDNVVKVPFKF